MLLLSNRNVNPLLPKVIVWLLTRAGIAVAIPVPTRLEAVRQFKYIFDKPILMHTRDTLLVTWFQADAQVAGIYHVVRSNGAVHSGAILGCEVLSESDGH